MEWAVVQDPRFSEKGDSGALVVFGPQSAVGLLWGGNDVGIGDITYVTPIALVAQSILRTTGYHVRLPGGSDICCDFTLCSSGK